MKRSRNFFVFTKTDHDERDHWRNVYRRSDGTFIGYVRKSEKWRGQWVHSLDGEVWVGPHDTRLDAADYLYDVWDPHAPWLVTNLYG